MYHDCEHKEGLTQSEYVQTVVPGYLLIYRWRGGGLVIVDVR